MEKLDLSIIYPLIGLLIYAGCLIYVLAKQAYEIWVPVDWLTRLRWYLFGLIVVSFLATIPVIAYQCFRLIGAENELLRDIANWTGNTARLATGILLVMIWRYRREEEPEPEIHFEKSDEIKEITEEADRKAKEE